MKTLGSFSTDVCYSGQSKGCALSLHVGYRRFLWHPRWAGKRDGALIDVKMAAPDHNNGNGYRLRKWGLRVYGRTQRKGAGE